MDNEDYDQGTNTVIERRLVRLETTVHSLVGEVHSFIKSYKEGAKTDWSLILGSAAVVLSLVTIVGSIYVGQMKALGEAVRLLEARERIDFERAIRNEEQLSILNNFIIGIKRKQ